MAVDFRTQLAGEIALIGKRVDALQAGVQAQFEPIPRAVQIPAVQDARQALEAGQPAAMAPAEPPRADDAAQLAAVTAELKKAIETIARLLEQLGAAGKGGQPALPDDKKAQEKKAEERKAAEKKAGDQANQDAKAKPAEAGGPAAGGADDNQKAIAEIIEALAKLMPALTKLLMQVLSLAQTGKDLSVETHARVILGSEPGGWLVKHGQYKKNADGSYDITGGKYAGHKAIPNSKGQYEVFNPSGDSVGKYSPPGGAQKIASPLTFDLNGDGTVGTTSVAGGRQFDIDGDGKVDQTAWAARGDGVLAFDGNGDGVAGSDGTELFGNNTRIDGRTFDNGFEALEALAEKHLGAGATADGKLDAAELARLGEKAGLTMQVDGQQKSLADLGITEIGLGYRNAGRNADANGNEHRQVGAGFTRNGQNAAVNDVWFNYR